MRIRKRKVPFPISSLFPTPLSDPFFSRPPVVVQLQPSNNLPLQEHDDTDDYYDPKPSDQTTGSRSRGQDSFDAATAATDGEKEVLWQEREDEWVGEETNNARKGSPYNIGSLAENMILQQPYTSHQEKEFPRNERRESLERLNYEETAMEIEEKGKKTTVNKKIYVQQNGYVQSVEERKEQEEDGGENRSTKLHGATTTNSATSVKKRGRGRSSGALMEGSRCSRVNGRGWRCSQQTLVGYSLCEHHLGKGRLRSMNNVRNRSKVSKAAVSQLPLSKDEQEITKPMLLENKAGGENGGGGEKKPPVVSGRKMKFGMVKARSISSLLLDQENNNISKAFPENDYNL